MTLKTDNQFIQVQQSIAKENLKAFQTYKVIGDKLDDNEIMTYNVNESIRMLKELVAYNYNEFKDSYEYEYMQTKIEQMKTIVNKTNRGKEEMVELYTYAQNCQSIYDRYRGDNNDK